MDYIAIFTLLLFIFKIENKIENEKKTLCTELDNDFTFIKLFLFYSIKIKEDIIYEQKKQLFRKSKTKKKKI